MSNEATSRPYNSVVRAEQAARTRRRILDAAARCFAEKGYTATTLRDIARAAEVSVETVKAGGAKRDLVVAAWEQVFGGEEGPGSILERDEVRAILDIADADEFVRAAVDFVAAANARIAGLWLAFTSAANSDPAVYDALRDLDRRRHRDLRHMVEGLDRRGWLPAGADLDAIAQALYFVVSPESYEHLVRQAGWPADTYRAWLVHVIGNAVLAGTWATPGPGRPGAARARRSPA